MLLAEKVHIAPRFQKAVRIDTDLGSAEALRGFICPESSVTILRSMANHVEATGQAAFTWTGPYGSGKSSLVVALSALMNGNKGLREEAADIIGREAAADIWSKLPPRKKGWRILGVVGRKVSPAIAIGEAIVRSGYGEHPTGEWTEAEVLEALQDIYISRPSEHGGLVVFIDEMGKLLEASAQGQGDVYLLQQIAELASRSKGRLVLVGILHQAFDEYASRLSRDVRDEWSKIHGRFLDLPVNVAGEEQLALISRAIKCEDKSTAPSSSAEIVGAHIRSQRPASNSNVVELLHDCWPLHPITASLLGPISRRRFGQNQRSIFGFLNSAEPFGFQDFLKSTGMEGVYEPHKLWDYLQINLEPAILASPDGHRWAIAAEAVERCSALGGDDQHLKLLKSVAVIDLFRDRSGILPTVDILATALQGWDTNEIEVALRQLASWSLTIYKKFLGAYSIYAGSDFDIEVAVQEASGDQKDLDFNALRGLAGLQPILCKRHYHETGALRWFDVEIVPLNEIKQRVEEFSPAEGTIGQFLLAVPNAGEGYDEAKEICSVKPSRHWDSIVGLSQHSWTITKLAKELVALERVRATRSELQGDPVARREVLARLTSVQSAFEAEIQKAFDHAEWFRSGKSLKILRQTEINTLASDLAEARYPKSPIVHSELLNRVKPSSNAVAAQNALLKRMVDQVGRARLGIEGFPAEGGLFASLLQATNLYVQDGESFEFRGPSEGSDPARLMPLWTAASQFLRQNEARAVPMSELYQLWAAKPFGVKPGLMPVLAVAFVQSMKSSVALYRQGIFQTRFKDLDIDYLVKDASDLQVRWMDLNEASRKLLSGLADVVRDLDRDNTLKDLEPIDVGRGLIAIYDSLEPWTKRTLRLSSNALAIRTIFKKANDPNRLIFNDLPGLFGADAAATEDQFDLVIDTVRSALDELVSAYPEMVHRLRNTMLLELQVPNASPKAIAELRGRAENIRQLAGDFRLDAFVGRLANFHGTDADVEGLASLATSKPPKDWVDTDLDRAAVVIMDLSQQFNKAESFARVKGRVDKRHAMAVVIGIGGRPTPIFREFDISDHERDQVNALVSRLDGAVSQSSDGRLVLAALAEISARYITADVQPQGENMRDGDQL
tara:strand:- start:10892 stop:14266 length:3375 start_codon:yes stop_codon:yes gene_type:complete